MGYSLYFTLVCLKLNRLRVFSYGIIQGKVDILKLSKDNYSLWKPTIRNELHATDTKVFIAKDIKPALVDPKDIKKYWLAVSIITSLVSKELAHLVITKSNNPDQGYPFLLWK